MKRLRVTKKRLTIYFIIAAAVCYVLFIYTPILHLPVGWSNAMAGIKAEPQYVPFPYEKSYMTNRSCGKSCDKLKLHYEGSDAELVVTATDDVSWYDDPKWDKKTKINGTKYFYRVKDGKQYLYWRDDPEELELTIEYDGKNKLSKSEIVKIADSIKADGKLLN